MNDIVIKIGELLVRAGIVTGVDLSEAEKLAKHMNLQFGQVLIMSGCLSDHDLDCALVAQQLIREELLTVDIACQALAMASQHQMPFEDALEALSVVPKYGAASVEMAELLADAAIIPGEMLEEALMTSLTANVSLGELLVRENAISSSLIPVLNMMLADISAGVLHEGQAIDEIRKNHISWQRSQDAMTNAAQTPAAARSQEGPAPVFVSQELMHAYEVYEPQQSQQQAPQSQQQAHQASQPASPPYAQTAQPSQAPEAQDSSSSSSSSHSIHDVLSMFQQRNPVSENSAQAVPREQQAASWTAFVQSQSFDPNDVEPSVPPMSVAAEESRLRTSEEPSRPLEVVQGTYSKTFDGKSNDLLAETFEPIVPPDFEPAAEVIADYPFGAPTDLEEEEEADEEEEEDEPQDDEQFSLLVELLIESTYFDREDIIEAITNALKEESKAVKLIEMLGLADARAIMAASICADALRKQELTSGEAVTVLGDIKAGAEIHEALESVNLELAVTVSANLQMMFDDEIDETFYVGDVSRTVDIFEVDDFAEEQKANARKEGFVDATPPSAVEPKDELPPIAFGYGRERLKIAKRAEPPAADDVPKEAAEEAPVQEPLPTSLPVAAKAPDRPQTTIGGKKVSSLSEVFEKLSGVDSNGSPPTAPTPSQPLTTTTAPAASTPSTSSTPPTPSTPVARPPGSVPGAPLTSGPKSNPHSPAASGPIVRPGTPPIMKPSLTPPAAFGKAPMITPVADSTPAPKITPVVDVTPAPTITPAPIITPPPIITPAPIITPVSDSASTPKISSVADSSSAPKISPVADSTPSPTMTPVADSTPTKTISSSDDTKPMTSESPATNDSTSTTSTDVEPLSEEEKKATRKRNSTTFNSLQAVFVPAADALVTPESSAQANPDQAPVAEAAASDAVEEAPKETSGETFADVSNEASNEYAAYVSNKISDEPLVPEAVTVTDEPIAEESEKSANEPIAEESEKSAEEHSTDTADEIEEPVAASSSKKKARSPKAKVRGGAKTATATGTAAAAPKKAKKRK